MSPHLVWILGARDIVKCTRQRNSKKEIIIKVAGATVLIILEPRITTRNVVEVIEKRFPDPKVEGQVPLRVQDVLDSTSKRNGNLDIAIFGSFGGIPGDSK